MILKSLTCIAYILNYKLDNYIYENNMYKKLSIMVLFIEMYTKCATELLEIWIYVHMYIGVCMFIIVRIILLRYFRMKMVLVV